MQSTTVAPDKFVEAILRQLGSAGVALEPHEILERLEFPQDADFGDYAFPCFALAKTARKSPEAVAREIAAAISGQPRSELIERIEARAAYVNFFVNRLEMVKDALSRCFADRDTYGQSNIGAGRAVVIDYSSPNIAKPLSIGHLRSTVIGGALYRIYQAHGFKCVGVNHLGDWGTQIGTVIAAVKKWLPGGSPRDSSVRQLSELYARYHTEMAQYPALQAEAREWFRKLETGDPEASSLWRDFLELTISSLRQTYAMLGVAFDEYKGESFYNDKIEPALEELAQRFAGSQCAAPLRGAPLPRKRESEGGNCSAPLRGTLLPRMRESEGALIVDLADFGMPPCLLRKADGTTLYATRDIAAALYRYSAYSFARAMYVVAADQRLHFRQFFKVLELAGFQWAKDCVHVDFGLVRFKGEKMATRAGTVVLLEDVLNRSIELTREKMRDRTLDAAKREEIARAVGIGAIIFNDLKHKRVKDIDFDWEQILRFDGETGPYVQYTFVRIASIFKKYAKTASLREAESSGSATMPAVDAAVDFNLLSDPEEFELAKLIHRFPAIVRLAAERFEPSLITAHLLDCAGAFHKYYRDIGRHKVVSENRELTRARLLLCHCLKTVIANGLRLLGIQTVDEM